MWEAVHSFSNICACTSVANFGVQIASVHDVMLAVINTNLHVLALVHWCVEAKIFDVPAMNSASGGGEHTVEQALAVVRSDVLVETAPAHSIWFPLAVRQMHFEMALWWRSSATILVQVGFLCLGTRSHLMWQKVVAPLSGWTSLPWLHFPILSLIIWAHSWQSLSGAPDSQPRGLCQC